MSGSESDDESDWASESDESSSASDLEPLEGKEMEELRRYFLKFVFKIKSIIGGKISGEHVFFSIKGLKLMPSRNFGV